MCTHCGCNTEKAIISDPQTGQHKHLHLDSQSLQLHESLLAGNEALALKNRNWLARLEVFCINLMGTPGAGKTALLEATLKSPDFNTKDLLVLEGDQQTSNDAKRIQEAGGKVLQINTGTGCHLDADMIHSGIHALEPQPGSVLVIENVGNLVCPALFDLGENLRVTMMAVTDGADKPEKYPHMFSNCDLIIINKADLLPYLDFDLEYARQSISKLNPNTQVILLSATAGTGMDEWRDWLHQHLQPQTSQSKFK